MIGGGKALEGDEEVVWLIGTRSRPVNTIDWPALAWASTHKRNGGHRRRIGVGRSFSCRGRPPTAIETARPSTTRSKRECTSENEIKVSNALELVLWGIAIEPRATLAGSSRTGPTSQRPLYREQGVVDGGPAL